MDFSNGQIKPYRLLVGQAYMIFPSIYTFHSLKKDLLAIANSMAQLKVLKKTELLPLRSLQYSR